jgi:hypothetical protein
MRKRRVLLQNKKRIRNLGINLSPLKYKERG